VLLPAARFTIAQISETVNKKAVMFQLSRIQIKTLIADG